MHQTDTHVQSFGDCLRPFIPTMGTTQSLLDILSELNQEFALRTQSRLMFEELLHHFLTLTESEYGFIGQRLIAADGSPYLLSNALTNIAWNEETRRLYEDQYDTGLKFYKLDSLYGAVIVHGTPLISNTPTSDPRAGGIPDGHLPLQSFMGIPLYIADQFLGMVGVANRQGGYDVSLLDFLRPLTNSTAALIHAARMEDIATHDHLTGVANRRLLDQTFVTEISRHKRHKLDISLLLLDADFFKAINDTYGHTCGDRTLINLAQHISKRIRAEDMVARYGGEEFAILLPNTSLSSATALAQNLRKTISEQRLVSLSQKDPIQLTVSIGVATLAGEEASDADTLLKHADIALYQAKREGRNRVVQYDSSLNAL